MKKIILLLLTIFILGGCEKVDRPEEIKPGLIFKEEYEVLNGLEDIKYPEYVYREVKIDEDNPYLLTTLDELVNMIENKESFYAYFGDPKCPWCRSNIESAISKAKEEGISQIYYIHMWDEERNEIVRDKYEVIDGQIVKTVNGEENYFKLLDALDLYLEPYIIQDGDEQFDTNEKRIVMPSYIHFTDGIADKYSEGTSSNQNDSHQELNEEIISDQEKEFNSFFNSSHACSLNSKGC